MRAARKIVEVDAAGDAGLDRGLLLTGIGLIFWVVLGITVTRWYDRRGMYRIQPEILDYVGRSVREYGEQHRDPKAEGSGVTQ